MEKVTFGELKKRVSIIASVFKSKGIKCGDRVAGRAFAVVPYLLCQMLLELFESEIFRYFVDKG